MANMLLDIPGSLAYPQWGQQAGQNILNGRLIREERDKQNLLAQALPAALAGDPRATAAVAQASPQLGVTLGLKTQETARANAEKSKAEWLQATAGGIASIYALKDPAEKQARFTSFQHEMAKRFPQYDDGTIDDWSDDSARQVAYTLGAQGKDFADLFTRAGLIPQADKVQNRPYWINDDGTKDDARFNDELALRTAGAQLRMDNPPPETFRNPVSEQDASGNPVQAIYGDRGTRRVVPGALPKANAQQLASAKNAQTKMQTSALIRQQLGKVKDAWDEVQATKGTDAAGPLGGRVPTAAGEKFDKAVALLSPLIRQLTRVPGEGAMSDYESRLAALAVPNRTNWNDTTTGDQIQSYYDLLDTVDQVYNQFGSAPDAEAPPDDEEPTPTGGGGNTTMPTGWSIRPKGRK